MRGDLRDIDPPAEWLELLDSAWQMWARDDQLPPEPEDPASPWRVWVILGGRGAGKTRAGAEWIRAMALGEAPFAAAPVGRIALVGETLGDVRRVMIEGVSGLMAVHADSERPHFEASKLQLTWPNGTVAQMFSAENPDSLRGPQFACAWCDELAKWRLPETAWDMLQFGLRLGEHPQVAVTTTPRPIPLLRQLIGDAATVVTRASTIDNEKNLSPGFVAEMTRRYAGTALGRQELMGEIIEDMTGALWRREWIAGNRVRNLPDLARIVVAVDPPVTATESSDACGIVVAGLTEAGDGYVIADRTLQGREPHAWARAVVAAYHEFLADRVVAEVNQGGDLVVTVLRQIDATVAVRRQALAAAVAAEVPVATVSALSAGILLASAGPAGEPQTIRTLELEDGTFVTITDTGDVYAKVQIARPDGTQGYAEFQGWRTAASRSSTPLRKAETARRHRSIRPSSRPSSTIPAVGVARLLCSSLRTAPRAHLLAAPKTLSRVRRQANPTNLVRDTALGKTRPTPRDVRVKLDHITSGHRSTGGRATQSTNKSLFPERMDAKAIDRAVREAYGNAKQVGQPQIDKFGDKRIVLEGRSGNMQIRMHYNVTSKTIETAYPPRR